VRTKGQGETGRDTQLRSELRSKARTHQHALEPEAAEKVTTEEGKRDARLSYAEEVRPQAGYLVVRVE